MVMPCCSNCYSKYLDENEELILDKVKEILKDENASIHSEKQEDSEYTEYSRYETVRKTVKLKKYKILSHGKVIELCSCLCHKNGCNIMH